MRLQSKSLLEVGESVARWARGSRPPRAATLPYGYKPMRMGSSGVRVKVTSGQIRPAKLTSLRHYVNYVLRHMTPIYNGALRVFLPSQARVALRQSVKTPSVSHGGTRTTSSPLGRFAWTRARLPQGQIVHRSMSYGVGLQSARSYSTGAPGVRLFENVVSNSPLALRALTLNASDESHCLHRGSRHHVVAQRQRHTRETKKSRHTYMPYVPSSHAHENRKVAEAWSSLCDADVPLSSGELDTFFPLEAIVPSQGPVPMKVTRMLLFLSPLQVPDCSMNAGDIFSSLQTGFLDNELQEKLVSIRYAYKNHAKRLRRIEYFMRKNGMWPKHIDIASLVLASDSSTRPALELVLPGWHRDDIEATLFEALDHEKENGSNWPCSPLWEFI